MRIKNYNKEEHKWFAWYPVKVGEYTVWFEYVIRYKTFIDCDYDTYSYKLLNNK